MKKASSNSKVPTDQQLKESWDFVRRMREEWTTEDWADFYHGISFAFFRIELRHRRNMVTGKGLDYQI